MSEDFDLAEDPPSWPPSDEIDAPPPDLNERRLVDPRTLPARFHHLRAAGQAGALALHAFQGDGAETLARRLGSGAHAMLLGKPWVPWDQPSKASVDRRAKAMARIRGGAKEPIPPLSVAPRSGDDWKQFASKHAGSIILTPPERDAAQRMVDAIRAHPKASALLETSGVIYERSIIWSQCGRARQSTPDVRGPALLAEIKTTRCADPRWFPFEVKRYCYHAQLADQRAAIEHETGESPRDVYIIAVEKTRPHIVQVYRLAPSALEEGEKLCQIWLERLQLFEATNLWGGYSERIELLELPEHSEVAIADPDWMSEDDSDEK